MWSMFLDLAAYILYYDFESSPLKFASIRPLQVGEARVQEV